MRVTRQSHLTADDLDALLTNAPSPEIHGHLEACPACFEMARLDMVVVSRLESAVQWSPRPDFIDRVMARVTLAPTPFRAFVRLPRRVLASRRAMGLAAMWTLVVGAAMTASILWSLSNRSLLDGWGNQLVAQGSQWFWLGLRALAANLAEQPWYEQARAIVTSPGRLTGLLVGISVAYATGVLAFRHLIAIPTRPVHDARA